MTVDEHGAQHIVALDQPVPGGFECSDIQSPPKAIGDLLHIGLGIRLIQGVKKHPLLHRGHGINFLQIFFFQHVPAFNHRPEPFPDPNH